MMPEPPTEPIPVVAQAEAKRPRVWLLIPLILASFGAGAGAGFVAAPAGSVQEAIAARLEAGCLPLVNGVRAATAEELAFYRGVAAQVAAQLRSAGQTNVDWYTLTEPGGGGVIWLYAEDCQR